MKVFINTLWIKILFTLNSFIDMFGVNKNVKWLQCGSKDVHKVTILGCCEMSYSQCSDYQDNQVLINVKSLYTLIA